MTKWIIQANLTKTSTLEQFRHAFRELNIEFKEVQVIPFSSDLPTFTPSQFNIFYGSTSLMLNAYANSKFSDGIFYDPAKFNVSTYLDKWPDKMLNSDGRVIKFSDFIETDVDKRSEWFLRPNEDDKSFAGTTMTSQEIKDWYRKIKDIDNPTLNCNTLIFASQKKTINKEWRNFIVNGKVIDSSRYMKDGAIHISHDDCPKSMIDFTEAAASTFSPHDIFVMDIAETSVGFKIIECNCFNGTGFYHHNIKKIIKAVTDRIAEINPS